MSKKNLARSAIEGGRYGRNKWERRYSHTEERNAAREYCKQAIRDLDSTDEDLIDKKGKVYKEFRDKLSPMYRWLRAQVGRPWDEVRSEVFQKFDTRTTAGRHILFDHLLKSVETDSSPLRWWRLSHQAEDPETTHYQNDFYVDEDGFLQERRYISRRSRGSYGMNFEFVAKWLNGRIVGWEGNKYYWYTPSMKDGWIDEWKCQWSQYGGKLTYLHREYQSVVNNDRGKSTFKAGWVEPHYFVSKNISVQQGDEFSDEDLEIWFQIPDYYRKQILEYFPRNK